MVSLLKMWFTLPQFADEDQTRLARQVRAILLVILVAVIISLIAQITLAGPLISVFNGVLTALAIIFSLLLLTLHRGYIRTTSLIIVLSLWFAIGYYVWQGNGVPTTAIGAYILVIATAALLLERIYITMFAILSVIANTFFIYAEAIGLLIPQPRPALQTGVSAVLLISLVTVLIHLLMNNLMRVTKRIQANNQQLQTLSTDLAQRTHLAEQAQADAEAARQEMSTQIWLTMGQAQLSQAIRGEQDIKAIANMVISHICHYLNIPIGILFILEGDSLLPVGSYAHTQPNDLPTNFKLGEGLIGEAALQGETLMLTNIAPNHLTIVSGTGKLPLQHILAHPFAYDDQVIGVIELGHWHPFTPQQKMFLQSATNIIAVAFHTAQARAQIDALINQ